MLFLYGDPGADGEAPREELVMKRLLACFAVAFAATLAMGTASAQTVGPADTIWDLRFGDHITYERAVIDLGYAEVPADFAPNYRWTTNGGGTVVRVVLPTVSSTFTTDGFGLGKSISSYYVVRSLNGAQLATEFHLTDAAGFPEVFYLNYPARIVIDVPTTGQNFYPDPVVGENVVVKQPREYYTVGPDIFTVTGYARPFEAQGTWRIKDAFGNVAREGTYFTSDWATTWGRFAFSADYPAYLAGQGGTLELGEYSARDGSFVGVSIPLYFR